MEGTPEDQDPDMARTAEDSWAPMERFLPEAYWGDFMLMQSTDDGLEVFKHRITKIYLVLDHHGQAYSVQSDGTCTPVAAQQAMEPIRVMLEQLGWTRETHYDDEFLTALAERWANLHPPRRPPRPRCK